MTIAKGSPMLADDINNLTFFPKGTILTFSSEAWNSTSTAFREIWKICNTDNHASDNTIPDLTNKFLRGGTSSGATGTGQKTLSVSELPSHSHPSGTLAVASSGAHTHDVTDPGHKHKISIGSRNGANKSVSDGGTLDNYYAGIMASVIEKAETGISINNTNSAHSHSLSGAIGSTGSGDEFDIIPAFYTVIYIIKVT
jgi:microcystin-dependent protein